MIQQGRSLARRRRYPLPSSGSAFAASTAPSPALRGQQELGSPPGAGRSHTVYTQLKS